MNELKLKQIYNLVNTNEDIRLQLENTEGIEEIVAILNANSIEVTLEDISAAISSVTVGDEELDESALDDVSGGYCKKGRNWNCFGHYLWNALKGIFDELSSD